MPLPYREHDNLCDSLKAKKLGSPEGLPNTSILALVGIRVNTHVGEKIENLYFQQVECGGFIQYCALKRRKSCDIL